MSDKELITFLPAGISVETDPGRTLMALARDNGLWLESACGGSGRCRSCLVKISDGSAPEPSASEKRDLSEGELQQGWRRSCSTIMTRACTVLLPSHNQNPEKSHQEQSTSDMTAPMDLLVSWDQQLQGWVDVNGRVYSNKKTAPLGIALDLGTTNLSMMLIDLATGMIIGKSGLTNPQVYYGADVISRMDFAKSQEDGIFQLQDAVVSAIDKMARALAGDRQEDISVIAVAGNTVMHHLLHGLSIENLACAPYTPEVTRSLEIPAEKLGLHFAPDATIYTPPNVAGFVGGDHIAALSDVMSKTRESCWAMIDIGTNSEIALYLDGKIYSASCASGPALEGGHISCGMRAKAGAIEHVLLQNKSLSLSTIDDQQPIGLCGSGIISITANLSRNGLIDKRGRLQLKSAHIRETASSREFVLYDQQQESLPVVFSQRDVRAVQLAKGAIMTGLSLLLEKAGIEAGQLEALYIAGTFGAFIDLDEAIDIGMLPDMERSKIHQIGNAAQHGIARMLNSHLLRKGFETLAQNIEYVELASQPGFQKTFIRCNQFQPGAQ